MEVSNGYECDSQSIFSGGLQKLAEAVSAKIKSECSGIRWKVELVGSVDVVEANDPKQIEKAAMIIRAYGHSTTETLTATPWKEFLGTL
jgi:uncharacterized protein with GYD domain